MQSENFLEPDSILEPESDLDRTIHRKIQGRLGDIFRSSTRKGRNTKVSTSVIGALLYEIHKFTPENLPGAPAISRDYQQDTVDIPKPGPDEFIVSRQ
jgi:hypothetical protein